MHRMCQSESFVSQHCDSLRHKQRFEGKSARRTPSGAKTTTKLRNVLCRFAIRSVGSYPSDGRVSARFVTSIGASILIQFEDSVITFLFPERDHLWLAVGRRRNRRLRSDHAPSSLYRLETADKVDCDWFWSATSCWNGAPAQSDAALGRAGGRLRRTGFKNPDTSSRRRLARASDSTCSLSRGEKSKAGSYRGPCGYCCESFPRHKDDSRETP